MRSNTLDAARRAYLGIVRGTVHAANDKPKMQTMDARLLHNELLTGIERPQHYGFSSVPPPPDPSGGKAGEVFVGFVNGNRSHPIVLATDDRRYRPINGESGQTGLWHYKGHGLKLVGTGFVYDAGPQKQPHTTTVGNASVTIADGKITATVDKLTIVLTADKICLGSADASDAVMLQSGPSTKIFGAP